MLTPQANVPSQREPAERSCPSPRRVYALDLRGIPCPLNLVKAKLAIEKISVGDILDIELDDGEPIQNLPVSLGRQGQEILATTKHESHFCLRVRRRL
jgi:sulfite reductase (ferredoxin)